ncbi:MAG: 4Fe-4S dicluster domain-containing protein [Planctomycetaceae bacterium]|nr:4Fe-4S dicluster domain-containing protein [Planctomycetaceae bacterium]MBT6483496.1 4Fe-4S dicluster domain-containing protein [Planctomycetaceae bacterium]MBT6494693.1 4Fe-4S dicluster domain-containing protein [Planctomycetaceae bacterium]
MEGMPEHPLSRGGLCAIGQALPLELYDRLRLQHPLQQGKQVDWKDIDRAIAKQLSEIAAKQGAVRFVTSTVTSPTLKSSINQFLSSFDNAQHVTFDAISCSAILDAHEQTHGVRVLPHFRFDQARVIASFGADFLGTWISPVEFTAAWRAGRVPTETDAEMSHHTHLEDRMSLTGSNADRRFRLSPDDYGGVLSHLATRLVKLSDVPPPAGKLTASPIPDKEVAHLADRLWESRGASLVVCDSQDIAVQSLVNFINHLLGNYGETIDIARPSYQRQGNDRDVIALIEELNAGQVDALFVAGNDLTHNLPEHAALVEAIKQVPLVVSFAEREDDFSSLAHFVCPDHHPLESWLDAEQVNGLVSLSQPTLQPLGETRSILESLNRWVGNTDSAYEILRSHWKANVLPRAKSQEFNEFWDHAVHDGFVEVEPRVVSAQQFQTDAVRLIERQQPTEGFSLSLYPKIGLADSRNAHNPWLQELPDPVTKVTWDNYVCISPLAAEELSLSNGDVVRVTTADGRIEVELPTLIQPGQHDRILAIALGYGVRGTDRFANIGPDWIEAKPMLAEGELVGKNVAGFIEAGEGAISYFRNGITLEKTGRRRELATTQRFHSLEVPPHVAPHGGEVREQIQETTLAAYRKNPKSGAPESHHPAGEQLWAEDHPKTIHQWGMVIDLNACTGCSACLVACQSENNVPVVGKDEVRRQREMHWIRIDRYYSGNGDETGVAHQPMMCQHCGNAPCETVCPVLATVHSEEGLNEQAYNRCVGTRYCANNCPYKVRRFNWFDYEHNDTLQNLVLNPDVTVRSRGVMEKCSMCVQRIEEGKIAASSRGEPLTDGEIQTACQQSCPAQAIVFGDMNPLFLFAVPLEKKSETEELDKRRIPKLLRAAFQNNEKKLPEHVSVTVLEEGHKWQVTAEASRYVVRKATEELNVYEESRVGIALANPRSYGVLEEFNFRPAVSYLRVVNNTAEDATNGGGHV